MRQRADTSDKLTVHYHSEIDEVLRCAEETKTVIKNKLSPELAEKIDRLFETEDESEQERLLLEIIAQCPKEKQAELGEKLAGPLAEIEEAVKAGEIPQQKIAALFQHVLFAEIKLQEKEIGPLGNSSVLRDVLKGFSKTLLEAAFPKTMIVALLGSAIVPVAAQTISARFFSGVAAERADPCFALDANCTSGYWQDMANDVLGTLKRVVRAATSQASSSAISGQKLCLGAEKVATAANLEFSVSGKQCSRTVTGPIYYGAQATITINASKVTEASCANVEQSLLGLMDDCANLGSTLKGAAKNALIAGSVIGGVLVIVGAYMLARCAIKKCNQNKVTPVVAADPATTIEMNRV